MVLWWSKTQLSWDRLHISIKNFREAKASSSLLFWSKNICKLFDILRESSVAGEFRESVFPSQGSSSIGWNNCCQPQFPLLYWLYLSHIGCSCQYEHSCYSNWNKVFCILGQKCWLWGMFPKMHARARASRQRQPGFHEQVMAGPRGCDWELLLELHRGTEGQEQDHQKSSLQLWNSTSPLPLMCFLLSLSLLAQFRVAQRMWRSNFRWNSLAWDFSCLVSAGKHGSPWELAWPAWWAAQGIGAAACQCFLILICSLESSPRSFWCQPLIVSRAQWAEGWLAEQCFLPRDPRARTLIQHHCLAAI